MYSDHDASYKSMFSLPEAVRDLLLHFVPDEWLSRMNFDTLEKVELEMTLAQRFDQWAHNHQEKGKLVGRQEGRLEGEALVLQILLGRRFGPLPVELGARIGKASCDQIETWAGRFVDARSLDEDFCE